MQNQRWLSWLLLLAMGYLIYTGSQSRGPVTSRAVVPPPAAITPEHYPALAEATDIEAWKRKLNPDYAAVMNCSLPPTSHRESVPFRVVEDAPGTDGPEATCGDRIVLRLTVWNAQGVPGFRQELKAFALGSRQLAAGLDYGLLGMKPGSVRTLILPPSALVRGKADTAFDAARKALPTDTLAIVTVERLAH